MGFLAESIMIFRKSLIEIALKEYGIKDWPGKSHNPRILEYMKGGGFDFIDDETSWCSIFLNWCCKEAGLKYSGKPTARSWLNIGIDLLEKDVRCGDIVIYWRDSPESWKGHVGIFVANAGDLIYTLGGNQNDMVCILPYSKIKVLGYRRLITKYF